MNTGATILDDRETVELIGGHPHLLAIADAVRATQVRRTSLAHRRRPLLVAAAGLAACGAAAALTVVLAVPGATQHSGAGSGTLPPMPPAITVPVDQAQSDTLKAFGVPLILPDTSVLGRSDSSPTVLEQPCRAAPEVPTAPLCWVNVQFASPGVDIRYVQTSHTWGSRYPDAHDQYQREIANATNASDFQILSLSGTPALIETGQTGNSIEFRLGELSITIKAPNADTPTTIDAARLQALAQSMLDQAGNA